MTYLPSLIKKIDNFYHLINLGAVTPDYSYDPNKPQEQEIDERGDKLYQDIMSNLDNFENSSIADEVWTLAELYKASLLTGSGFDECLKRAKAAKGSVKDLANGAVDARDLADATRYISEIELNLTKAARSAPPVPKDDPAIIAQFKAISNSVKEKQAAEEMAGQESVYEKGMEGNESSYLVGNPTGVNKRREQYELEIQELQKTLNGPGHHISEIEKQVMGLLIKADEKLLAQMQTFVEAKTVLSAAPQDPEYNATYNEASKELNKLRQERAKIRVGLAKSFQIKKANYFTEQSKNKTGPEKEWLERKAEFYKLRSEDKYNKKPAIHALLAMLEATGKIITPVMGHETFVPINISDEMRQELNTKINETREKLLTPAEFDRNRTVEKNNLRKIRFKDPENPFTPTKEERKGIHIREYNFSEMQLSSYVQLITDICLAKRKSFKDNILNKIKGDGKDPNKLKPFIDNVQTAANKGDNIGPAIKELRQNMKEMSGVKDEVMTFLFSIRVSKLFYQFRDDIKEIDKKLGITTENTNIDPDFSKLKPEDISEIIRVIKFGVELIQRFKEYRAKIPFVPEGHPAYKKEYAVIWGPQRAVGNNPTDLVLKTITYLNDHIKNLPGV
jgi:hypothetical protein